MRMTILLAFAATLVPFPADAATLKDGFPICVSSRMLDQMYRAILGKDMRGMDYLFDHGCFMTKQGVPVSLLDRSEFGSQAHVRVYSDRGAVEAWTSMGALQGDQP